MDLAKLAAVESKIRFIRSNLRRGNIVDIGFLGHSAEGFKTCPTHKALVHSLNGKVFGMDLEWWEMRESKLKVDWAVEFGEAEDEGWGDGWLAGDACCMPLKDDSVGNIVAADLVEHLWNLGEFLDECKRVLIKYGRLIITTPNPYYIDNWLYVWLKSSPLVNPDHKALYCPITLCRLLAYQGFKIQRLGWIKGRWNLGGFITHRNGWRYDHMVGGWQGKHLPGEKHLLAILRAIWWPLRYILTLFSPLTRYSDYGVVCEK